MLCVVGAGPLLARGLATSCCRDVAGVIVRSDSESASSSTAACSGHSSVRREGVGQAGSTTASLGSDPEVLAVAGCWGGGGSGGKGLFGGGYMGGG